MQKDYTMTGRTTSSMLRGSREHRIELFSSMHMESGNLGTGFWMGKILTNYKIRCSKHAAWYFSAVLGSI